MTISPPSPVAPVNRRAFYWSLALFSSVVLSLTMVLPFFWLGSASGHDFEFHVASWLDVAYQWKEGILYPRWTAWTNHGFGEPRFIFYPPLSWVLGAALCLLLPGPWVPVVFVVLAETVAGISAFFLLRRLTSERAAVFGTMAYVVNANALLMTYLRSDFAEQLACAILPLVLLFALKLSELLDAHSNPSWIPLFALCFAGVWLSNAPAGVVASYAVAFLFGWAALTKRSWRILLRGAAGVALGLGLAGFYIVPAAFEQRWVNISQALSSGLLPSQNFLFSRIDDVEHTWFNWIASTCALLLILLFCISVIASGRFSLPLDAKLRMREAWTALLLLGAVASLLMFRITTPLWNYLPKLRFVQFPWRWMSVVAIVSSCFLAAAVERRRGWFLFALVLVLSFPLASFLVNNGWWDRDEVPTQQAAITEGLGFDGTDEYDPLGDDHQDLPLKAPRTKILPAPPGSLSIPDARVQIEKWTTEEIYLRIDTPSQARLALRLLNYPAWGVQVNGKRVQPERLEDVNQMVIPVEKGTSEIRVRFMPTLDRTLGLLLTLASVLATVLLFVVGRIRSGAGLWPRLCSARF
jgi:hypothetical protein